jgi:hypothetical protein
MRKPAAHRGRFFYGPELRATLEFRFAPAVSLNEK